MSMYDENKLIQDLLKIKAVTLNPKTPYTWASGIKAPIYTDNRLTIAYPEIRKQIARLLASKIKNYYPEVTVIGGVATAGIAHATSVSNILDLPLNYVRSKPKDHGQGQQIEGRCQKGDRVVLIDDLISTGGSIIKTVHAVNATGAQVVGTAAIFSYALPQAKINFQAINTPLISLITFPELIEIAKNIGYIDHDELVLLRQWYQDPMNWGIAQ